MYILITSAFRIQYIIQPKAINSLRTWSKYFISAISPCFIYVFTAHISLLNRRNENFTYNKKNVWPKKKPWVFSVLKSSNRAAERLHKVQTKNKYSSSGAVHSVLNVHFLSKYFESSCKKCHNPISEYLLSNFDAQVFELIFYELHMSIIGITKGETVHIHNSF